ncbi:anti-sigma F factor antagonist [Haloplasma contractile]|uniref:Anti-sigma F factor antagonist n=1 Tax=Haloplasma contractile SSD-17B TaxID=1033810 RepID=F7PVL2_9MOLU|nr:anti-sigma F factor antagonist [Haloplasma contractile]ERJ12822.1 Anti-sigma F factor antagonist protein [Haloplasma contractile SSD-17B]
MSLSVQIYIKSDTLFVRLSGELDHHTSGQLKNRVDDLMERYDITNMVFNMRQLEFMDSSGIGVILGRYKQLKRFNGMLVLCELNDGVERLVKLAGLHKICVVTKDETQAINYLGVA